MLVLKRKNYQVFSCNSLHSVICLLTVKQAGTDATYTGIVIAGIAVTGIACCFFIGMLC